MAESSFAVVFLGRPLASDFLRSWRALNTKVLDRPKYSAISRWLLPALDILRMTIRCVSVQF